MTRTIVAVGGFSSEVGKTTLLCEFLRAFPGWEAIKMTRGHYRSCGKSPHACCVSHLLGDEPVIRSGRAQTYTPGKGTGRYWDAGAEALPTETSSALCRFIHTRNSRNSSAAPGPSTRHSPPDADINSQTFGSPRRLEGT